MQHSPNCNQRSVMSGLLLALCLLPGAYPAGLDSDQKPDWKQPPPFPAVPDVTLVPKHQPGATASYGFSAAMSTTYYGVFSNGGWDRAAIVCSPGSPDTGLRLEQSTGEEQVANEQTNTEPGYCELYDLTADDPSSESLVLSSDKESSVPYKRQFYRSKFGSSVLMDGDQGSYDLFLGIPTLASCDGSLDDDFKSGFTNYGAVDHHEIEVESDADEFRSKYSHIPREGPRFMSSQCVLKASSDFQLADDGRSLKRNTSQIEGIHDTLRNLFGFSSHHRQDGQYLAVGAPLFRWGLGSVVISQQNLPYQDDNDNPRNYLMCDHEYLERSGFLEKSECETPSDGCFNALKGCEQDQAWGYAVTTLRLRGLVHYAVGGPRANGIKGAVRVFSLRVKDDDGNKINKRPLKETFWPLTTLKGELLNSGFGTSLEGLDMYGDGGDHVLLVGEPYYQGELVNSYDMGRVTIYGYEPSSRTLVARAVVYGPEDKKPAMFGASVLSLGDIDGDRSNDFAVSATGADGGKVYIYSGKQVRSKVLHDPGIKIQPMQTLSVSGTEMFGFSISAADVDMNSYQDVVVTDVGSKAPRAFVFYSPSVVNVVSYAYVRDRYSFQWAANWGCDPSDLPDNYNFCFPLVIEIDARSSSLPGRRADKRNGLARGFNIRLTVQLEGLLQFGFRNAAKFQATENEFKIDVKPDFRQNVSVPIYANIQSFLGDTVRMRTTVVNLESGDISLKDEDAFAGKTVLSTEDYKYLKLAVGPTIDVSMNVVDKHRRVRLGDTSDERLLVQIVIRRVSGGDYLLAGKLQVRFPSALMSLVLSNSSVTGDAASCRTSPLGREVVECLFVDGRSLRNPTYVDLTFDGRPLVHGSKDTQLIPVQYHLDWNNRDQSVKSQREFATIHLEYESSLQVNPHAESFYSDEKFMSRIIHSVSLSNNGPSKIGATLVAFNVTNIKGKIYGSITDAECAEVGEREGWKEFKCSHPGFEYRGDSKQYIIKYQVDGNSKNTWLDVLRGRDKIVTRFRWEVTEQADYNLASIQGRYPANKRGADQLSTRIKPRRALFPWWIIILTALICTLFLLILIIVLANRGFFSKKPIPNAADNIVLDNIPATDLVDGDAENFSYNPQSTA